MLKLSSVTIVVAVVSFIVGGAIIFLYMSSSSNFKAKQLKAEIETLWQTSGGKIKYEALLKRNPRLANHTKATDCMEGLGVVYSSPQAAETGKPRVNILTFNGRVIGILSVWPASEGWFPYADQSKGYPITSGGTQVYTQKVFFEAPPTANDCASINP